MFKFAPKSRNYIFILFLKFTTILCQQAPIFKAASKSQNMDNQMLSNFKSYTQQIDSKLAPILDTFRSKPGLTVTALNSTGALSVEDCSMQEDAELSAILFEQFLPSYNKQMLPLLAKKSVEINVEIQINAISHFSELDASFELDLFFSELWHEPRLAFDHLSQAKCIRNMTLGLEYLQRIWTPNVCVVNSKAAVIHSSPSENVFLILYEDGMVWKNCRMLVRGPCTIDLRLFPFDTQHCSLIFESYSYNSEKVTLSWMNNSAVRLAQTIEMPDFILASYTANRSIVTYPNGQWDQLMISFIFERRYGFFIMQAFLPTYMTVFVAWINFWMDPKELATRATLAISAFLAMCLQLGNVQQNQPRVSYVKAMDVWMLGSISFLFLPLIELAIISYTLRTDKNGRQCYDGQKRYVYIPLSPGNMCNEPKVSLAQKYSRKIRKGLLYHSVPRTYPRYSCKCESVPKWVVEYGKYCENQNDALVHNAVGTRGTKSQAYFGQCENVNKAYEGRCLIAYKVDKFFLILYPPAYLTFNIFYWTYYL